MIIANLFYTHGESKLHVNTISHEIRWWCCWFFFLLLLLLFAIFFSGPNVKLCFIYDSARCRQKYTPHIYTRECEFWQSFFLRFSVVVRFCWSFCVKESLLLTCDIQTFFLRVRCVCCVQTLFSLRAFMCLCVCVVDVLFLSFRLIHSLFWRCKRTRTTQTHAHINHIHTNIHMCTLWMTTGWLTSWLTDCEREKKPQYTQHLRTHNAPLK